MLGAYLRNPIADYPRWATYKTLVTQKILQLSKQLHFEKERILNWAFAYAIISLLWHLEDETDLHNMYISNAQLLHDIRI